MTAARRIFTALDRWLVDLILGPVPTWDGRVDKAPELAQPARPECQVIGCDSRTASVTLYHPGVDDPGYDNADEAAVLLLACRRCAEELVAMNDEWQAWMLDGRALAVRS